MALMVGSSLNVIMAVVPMLTLQTLLVSEDAIGELLGQKINTAVENTVNTAIKNAVKNSINAAVQNAVDKTLKRSIEQSAQEAIEKAVKKLRDGSFDEQLMSFLSENDTQASQNNAPQTQVTSDNAKQIKVVKDFHRHASDFVTPGKIYQIYIHDETDGDTYRMLETDDGASLRLALPEQVESGAIPISYCQWQCRQKGLRLHFYNRSTGMYLCFDCDDVEGGNCSLGAAPRECFDRSCLFHLQRNTDGAYMFLHRYEGFMYALSIEIIENNYSPSNFSGLYAIAEKDHQRGDFIWKFKEVAKT